MKNSVIFEYISKLLGGADEKQLFTTLEAAVEAFNNDENKRFVS